MPEVRRYELVVIGTSAGGMDAIRTLLFPMPADFSMPVAIVQHIAPSSDGSWPVILDKQCTVAVKEADEKETLKPGTVYFAPANYHLLIEQDHTFTLTVDEPVNYARPAIDVLFETAAAAFGPHVIGIILTGANTDGAKGLWHIRDRGGLTIVQDPATAEVRSMPEAAIILVEPDHILPIAGIRELLLSIHNQQRNTSPL